MTIDFEKLKSHHPYAIMDGNCRQSAVCIPLIENGDSFDVLFEVRSSKVENEPGDICFPGGMIEKGETYRQTAVREMCEELGVAPSQIEVLGDVSYMHNPNLTVYALATELRDYRGSYSADEVAEVFTVPLSFFAENEPDIYSMEWKPQINDDFPFHLVNGGKSYGWRKQIQSYVFWQYDNRVIWGITAKILYHFIKDFEK